MQFEHAEHTLETIRTLMSRSQRYEHISGHSGLVAGSAVLVGCAALSQPMLVSLNPRERFSVVWAMVFGVALVAHLVLTFARARQRGEPVWSRQARTVLLALTPNFFASLAVGVLMWRIDQLDLLPSCWLILYGCAALATSFFAPRSILVLGASCLALGVGSLIFLPGRPLLTMAVGFGFTHLAFGGCVLFHEWKEAREQALFTAWERNSAA